MSDHRPFIGITVLILSTWSLSSLDAGAKWIMHLGLPLMVLLWARYLVHALLVLSFTLPSRGLSIFYSKQMRSQVLRGTVVFVATTTLFKTLSLLPQAEATAINFLAPLLVLCLAPFFLKEPSRFYRWIAAICGFVGVLIIVRPGSGLDPLGIMFGLTTATLFSIQFMLTRRLAADDSLTTLLWTGVIGTMLSTTFLLFYLDDLVQMITTFRWIDWVILVSTGFFGALGHWLQIKAYQNAPASLLAPFVYLQIVAASSLGWLIWRQFPDSASWVGIIVVCGSGIVVSLVEWRNNQEMRRLLQAKNL